MRERAAWGSWSALLSLALASAGCGSEQADALYIGSPDYQLGGQTGSLVPGCGIAPLSAEGQSVPVGRALAVFYAKDCPGLAAQGRLALSGAGREVQPLELIRLAGDTYLLQAAASVPAGDYQLELGEGASALSVAEGEVEVPAVFGALSSTTAETTAEETAEGCPELLRFTLELDPAALALVPLARWEVSLDGGPEQLWVDYGALRIESDEAGSRGLLELPRCGVQGCLSPGPHHLQLRVSVAGQSREPQPLQLDFEPCPWPDSVSDGDEGCALGAPRRSSTTALGLGTLAVALALGWRRRGERRAQLCPHMADPLREHDPT
ncbi:MAG: hypothetical protein RL685_3006 [Pseudomonadota bacterium]|jgi:hypothetical protein